MAANMIYNSPKPLLLFHRRESNMSDLSIPEKEKKIYTKPIATEVHLVAEEAVLATCKVVGGSNAACPSTPSCTADQSGS